MCNLAICTVVIRRTDLPDELATDALVKALGHVVLHEFLDQVAHRAFCQGQLVPVNPTEELARLRLDTCVHEDDPVTVTLLNEMFCSVCNVDVPVSTTPPLPETLEKCTPSTIGIRLVSCGAMVDEVDAVVMASAFVLALPATFSKKMFWLVPPRPANVLRRKRNCIPPSEFVVVDVTYTLLTPPEISLPTESPCPAVAVMSRMTRLWVG